MVYNTLKKTLHNGADSKGGAWVGQLLMPFVPFWSHVQVFPKQIHNMNYEES